MNSGAEFLAGKRIFATLMASLALIFATQGSDPDYAILAKRGWAPMLLPGMKDFAFAHYGVPDKPAEWEAYTRMLKERGLANAYNPGPAITTASPEFFSFLAQERVPIVPWYGWPYFQVGDSPTPLDTGVLGKFKPLIAAGVFCAMEFGEWDYYFHDLSSLDDWFRKAAGKDYERLKSLRRPAGLNGYKTPPATRQAAFDEMKAYFMERKNALGGNVISMTGHSQYEAYAAEWGASVVGVELGENIRHPQTKLAFARGASRQWTKPFAVQVSPWLMGNCTSSGAMRVEHYTIEGEITKGLDAGHSLSFARRAWLRSWFAGAAMVTPEASSTIFFDGKWQDGLLNEYGRAAQEDYKFMREHDRGIPYTPIAIVLDHLAGYNAYEKKDWGAFDPSVLELQPRTLFQEQLFPGSGLPYPKNPEAEQDASPTPYGEICDVILTPASAAVMASYPILLLTGRITLDEKTISHLAAAARSGSRILIHSDLARYDSKGVSQLRKTSQVEILQTKEPKQVITDAKLRTLEKDYLPIHVSGDSVAYQINRNQKGWVIAVSNQAGIIKFGNKPAQIRADAVAHVRLSSQLPAGSAREWRTGQTWKINLGSIELAIPPGEIRFVEYLLR